jgi:phage tail-like protein
MPFKQSASIAHLATDPLRNFKFLVDITTNSGGYALPNSSGGTLSLGFMSVSGLNVNLSVIAYREGGMNTTTQKLPGQADFSPIVLQRGVAVGHSEDIAWLKQLFQVIQGSSGGSVAGRDFRQTVDVRVLAAPVTGPTAPVSAWFRVFNAWPTAVGYSDLDAGTNQLLISQMTLAHEGWDYDLATSMTTDAATPGTSTGLVGITAAGAA